MRYHSITVISDDWDCLQFSSGVQGVGMHVCIVPVPVLQFPMVTIGTLCKCMCIPDRYVVVRCLLFLVPAPQRAATADAAAVRLCSGSRA